MSRPIATRIYDLYGRCYSGFEWLFRKRLARALGAIAFREGDRALDIGVGTGISLEFYPPHVHVTGIDLSAGMLAAAKKKLATGEVRKGCREDATQLLQADALNLPFADKSFDVIFLSHVISTVPDPQRCLDEALRVAREQATIVLVNHFRSPWPVINWVETAIDPICRRLGWRTDLSVEHLLQSSGVEGAEKRRVGTGSMFRIVFLQKRRDGAGGTRVVEMPTPAKRKAELEIGRM
ncbi:MAG: methyltransferase domain-containing protein [Phycisphaerales bacterium]|nr:methyltransferase domain-containing protein [Phycisphaerales bacterium]